jgi:hypothetical protein
VRDPHKRPDAQTILKHEWLTGGAAAPETPMQPEILNRMKRFAGMNRFKKEALRVRLGRRGTQGGGGVVALEGGLTPPVCVDTALLICLVVCASLGGEALGPPVWLRTRHNHRFSQCSVHCAVLPVPAGCCHAPPS